MSWPRRPFLPNSEDREFFEEMGKAFAFKIKKEKKWYRKLFRAIRGLLRRNY